MKRKTFITKGKGHSTTSSILIGIGVSLVLSLLLSLLLTSLTVNGSITEDNGNLLVSAVRGLSVLIGSLIGAGIEKGKYIPVIGITSLGYLLVIMGVGILFYDGGFHGFGSGVISVLIGACVACILKIVRWSRPNRASKY